MTLCAIVTDYSGNALHCVSIEDLSNPTLLGSISGTGEEPYLGSPYGIHMDDYYAYVGASGDHSLTVINCKDATNPTFCGNIAGSLDTPPVWSPRFSQLVGDYAYVPCFSNSGGLSIIDISDPTSPSYLGNIAGCSDPANHLCSATAVDVVGDVAHVCANGGSENTSFLTMVDISDSENPSLLGYIGNNTGSPYYDDNWIHGPHDVKVKDGYAFVTSYYDDSLTVIDVSDPTAPVYVAHITTGLSRPWAIEISGNYAFVTSVYNDRLVAFDISDPTSPSYTGYRTTQYQCYGLKVYGDSALAANYENSSLDIYDISDPTSITLTSRLELTGYPMDVDVAECPGLDEDTGFEILIDSSLSEDKKAAILRSITQVLNRYDCEISYNATYDAGSSSTNQVSINVGGASEDYGIRVYFDASVRTDYPSILSDLIEVVRRHSLTLNANSSFTVGDRVYNAEILLN